MKSNRTVWLSLLLFMAFLAACSSSNPVTQDGSVTPTDSNLASLINESEVFEANYTGFALYDGETMDVVYQSNLNRYFTPASNTKLYTFYAALKMLPDSLLALEYTVQGDSLIFWGTGDPTFLHPDFEPSGVYDFLKESPYQLFYSDRNFEDKLLGPGWSWGDYQYSYSTERSPFPIYGNVARIQVEEVKTLQIQSKGKEAAITPVYFNKWLDTLKSGDDELPFLYRDFNDNRLQYSPRSDTVTYTLSRPFHYTPELITELLEDTLGREVNYLRLKKPNQTRKLFGIAKDTVLTRMLQPSDNFLAEQLLFNISAYQGYPMNAETVIEQMKKQYLNEFEQEPIWVDGSGLSRYNMFTPANMIHLLDLIRKEFDQDSLLYAHLPAGGRSGTIRNWYAHRKGGEPYVFAKTGTLSNNHSLSGYLRTEKGNTYLFSFMNNHYITASSVVKTEMEKVLWYLYKNY